jgi:hypothetical protein
MARGKSVLERRAKILDYMGGKCQICGYDKYSGALDLHHIDPKTKSQDFKRFYNMKLWPWGRVIQELSLCQLVCSNCHRFLHTIVGRGSPKNRYPARQGFADFGLEECIDEKTYSVLDIAKHLRVSDWLIRNAIKSGDLAANKINSRSYRITQQQYDDWKQKTEERKNG